MPADTEVQYRFFIGALITDDSGELNVRQVEVIWWETNHESRTFVTPGLFNFLLNMYIVWYVDLYTIFLLTLFFCIHLYLFSAYDVDLYLLNVYIFYKCLSVFLQMDKW